MRARRGLLPLAVAAVSAALTAASALAGSPPTVLLSGAGNDADAPSVGVSATGSALAAWAWGDVSQYATASALGRWSRASETPSPGSTALRSPANTVVAVAPNGDTVVAWTDRGEMEVRAFVEVGGRLSPSWIVAPAGGATVEHLSAAISDHGEAVVVWQSDSSPSRIQAVFPPARLFTRVGHRPSYTLKATTVSGTEAAYAPSAGIDASGHAVVIWADDSSPSSSLEYALAPPGGRFGTARVAGYLNQADSASTSPTLAVSPDGQMISGWNDGGIVADTGTSTGGFAPTQNIVSPSGSTPEQPLVAIDDNGNAVVGWPSSANGVTSFLVQYLKNGAPLGNPQQVDNLDENDAGQSVLRLGQAGQAWLAFVGDATDGSGDTVIDLATTTPTSSFTAPTQASEAGVSSDLPALAVNAKNQYALAWRAQETNDQIGVVGTRLSFLG